MECPPQQTTRSGRACASRTPRVPEDAEHGVGDAFGLGEVELRALDDLVGDVDDVAQHREQVLLDAADHLAVDEGDRRRALHLELDAPRLAHDPDLEVAVFLEQLLGIVAAAAGVEHRQRAAPEQWVEPALAAVLQLLHLALRQVLEAAPGGHPRVDELAGVDLGVGRTHGRISIGVLARVSSHTSSMSLLSNAMQPSVQSVLL